jgi:hypothetical protein
LSAQVLWPRSAEESVSEWTPLLQFCARIEACVDYRLQPTSHRWRWPLAPG